MLSRRVKLALVLVPYTSQKELPHDLCIFGRRMSSPRHRCQNPAPLAGGCSAPSSRSSPRWPQKGVSGEHLELLASLHHRSLAPLPQEPPPPIPVDQPPLPAVLLTLPEMVCSLQAQIAALQQQVADLTSLLQQQLPPPASSPAPAPQPKRVRRPPTPASPTPRSRPATSATAKTPPRSAHVLPRVEYGSQGRYVVICPKHGLLPLEPDTPECFALVAKHSSFRF